MEAIKQGYIILKIYEILHFESSDIFDETTKTGGIFTDYIKKFFKMKQAASGYPASVKTEKDKDAYILDYSIKEGILLDKSKI
jgi:hypothetical protein